MSRFAMSVLTFSAFMLLTESRSPEVEAAQQALKSLGSPWSMMLGTTGSMGDGVDGELGPLTRDALTRFLREADPALHKGPLSPERLRALGISAEPKAKSTGLVLVHGLTSLRSAEAQRELLARGLGRAAGSIELFSYKGDLDRIAAAVKASPASTVVLYSAGCQNAARVAELMKRAGSDLRRLWCLEPWAKGTGTVRSINSALGLGMPESNVVTGGAIERGGAKRVWNGATETPAGKDHFGALTALGELIARRED